MRIVHISFKLLSSFTDFLFFSVICTSLYFQQIFQPFWFLENLFENIWQENRLKFGILSVSEPRPDDTSSLLKRLARDGVVDFDSKVKINDPKLSPALIVKLHNIPFSEIQVVDSHPLQLDNPLRQRSKHLQHRTCFPLPQYYIIPLQHLQLKLLVPLSIWGKNGLIWIKVVRGNMVQAFSIFGEEFYDVNEVIEEETVELTKPLLTNQ